MCEIAVYTARPSQAYAWADFDGEPPENYGKEYAHLFRGRKPETWSKWALRWYRQGRETQPDFTFNSSCLICSRENADRFWSMGESSIQLLPIEVENEPWCLVLPLTALTAHDNHSMGIEWYKLDDGSRVIQEVRWINVMAPEPSALDVFWLSLEGWYGLYFTQRFVDRCRSLGLRGLDFKHVGYIVDSPEHAVPEPPRPPVAAPAPPRWPRWREPAVERVQASQAAGAAWLQRQGLPSAPPAADALAALAQAIEAARSPQARLGPKALEAFLAEVGGAWGHLLHRDCGWQWVELPVSSRTWRLGLASPEGRHALCLDQVIERQLAASSPSTLTLMFHMIAAGSLPDAQPGEHQVLG